MKIIRVSVWGTALFPAREPLNHSLCLLYTKYSANSWCVTEKLFSAGDFSFGWLRMVVPNSSVSLPSIRKG